VWWCTPVILATQEVEARGFPVQVKLLKTYFKETKQEGMT
jgi:hypothetical protein